VPSISRVKLAVVLAGAPIEKNLSCLVELKRFSGKAALANSVVKGNPTRPSGVSDRGFLSGAKLIKFSGVVIKPTGVIRNENKEPVLVSDSNGISLNEKLEDAVAREHKS
jgi:hypothetical protein